MYTLIPSHKALLQHPSDGLLSRTLENLLSSVCSATADKKVCCSWLEVLQTALTADFLP